MTKVIGTFIGSKKLTDELEESLVGTCRALTERGLEFGKCLLDRIEVG